MSGATHAPAVASARGASPATSDVPPALSRATLASLAPDAVALPDAALLDLPEKALQFGTGAFLRGFVDAFLDAANRQGRFGGRVVVVGSTGSGRDRAFAEQDGLYTLVTRGIVDGAAVEERRVVASVSRALSAVDDWDAVLAVARSPELEVIFSNTTEVGIALDEGDAPDLAPPRSFPGKLAIVLHERARHFAFAPSKAPVVVPCELIEGNGARLRAIVLALAERWRFEPGFARWVEQHVRFADTLVDRIVPGAPSAEDTAALESSLGYRDALLTACEPYRLFAIEGDDALRARLPWTAADAGIVVTPDVRPFRERKVRMLNGTHTIAVPLALLAGCETVRETMAHPQLGTFVRRVLLDEIVPTFDDPAAAPFAHAVLDRFANPHIRHALWDITLQGTMKLRVRVVPTILRHAARTGGAPPLVALGLAAHLLLLRGALHAARAAAGRPVPPDDQGVRLRLLWDAHAPGGPDAVVPDGGIDALVREALGDVALWDADLAAIPGLAAAVRDALAALLADGPLRTLDHHLATPRP